MSADPLEGSLARRILVDLLCLMGLIIMVYAQTHVAWRYFKSKKYGIAVITYLATAMFYIGYQFAIWIYLLPQLELVAPVQDTPYITFLNVTTQFIIFSLTGMVYTAHVNNQWRIKRNKQLEAENLRFKMQELENRQLFLDHQLDIHTTFNFFNFLYNKVYEKVPEAGDAIGLYTDYLRYSLVIKHDQTISLADEADNLKNYISIIRLLDKKLVIRFTQEGDFSTISIKPHLLFPFVENAIKHGEIHDPRNPILIVLKASDRIEFSVSNKVVNKQGKKSTGIGLENVKGRLQNYYNSQFALTIEESTERFDVRLSIYHDKDRSHRRSRRRTEFVS
ncbi:MAG: histidine kinase [Bacteroidota bacterium]